VFIRGQASPPFAAGDDRRRTGAQVLVRCGAGRPQVSHSRCGGRRAAMGRSALYLLNSATRRSGSRAHCSPARSAAVILLASGGCCTRRRRSLRRCAWPNPCHDVGFTSSFTRSPLPQRSATTSPSGSSSFSRRGLMAGVIRGTGNSHVESLCWRIPMIEERPCPPMPVLPSPRLATVAKSAAGHIRLTSHSGGSARCRSLGRTDGAERGPVIGTTIKRAHRNVIGTHSGSYSVYRALAVAAGALSVSTGPTSPIPRPTDVIGPYPPVERAKARSPASTHGVRWWPTSQRRTGRPASTSGPNRGDQGARDPA